MRMKLANEDIPFKEERDKLIYLAGILDGEGTIGIRIGRNLEGRRAKSPVYSIAVGIGNTDKRLIDWVKENFGGGVFFEANEKANYKDRYTWTVNGYKAYKLLGRVKGYLLLKREQAELAMKFYYECTRRNKGSNRKKPRPEWMIKKQENFYLQMKELNKTGKEQRVSCDYFYSFA